MKKVKLTLKQTEVEAIYADLFNNVLPFKSKEYTYRLVVSVLTNFYMRLAPKVVFKADKPIKLTLDPSTACALVIWIQIRSNTNDYIHFLYVRIFQTIDQQLA